MVLWLDTVLDPLGKFVLERMWEGVPLRGLVLTYNGLVCPL